MKLKSFDKYLATRLSKAEINAIEKRAKLEKKVLTHIAKIQKGTANLTLSSLAHLCAKIGEEPKLVFKKR